MRTSTTNVSRNWANMSSYLDGDTCSVATPVDQRPEVNSTVDAFLQLNLFFIETWEGFLLETVSDML